MKIEVSDVKWSEVKIFGEMCVIMDLYLHSLYVVYCTLRSIVVSLTHCYLLYVFCSLLCYD
jgi:hypothetical protein